MQLAVRHRRRERLAALNSKPGFAGYYDWRLPNVKELMSIVDYGGGYGLMVSPAFHDSAYTAGCTVLTCSCTSDRDYWSPTSVAFNAVRGFVVAFGAYTNGTPGVVTYAYRGAAINHPADALPVRAVRGGL